MIPAHLVWPLSHLEEPAEGKEVNMHILSYNVGTGKQAAMTPIMSLGGTSMMSTDLILVLSCRCAIFF